MSNTAVLWFNNAISSLSVILETIRSAKELGDTKIIVTHRKPNPQLEALSDDFHVEPKGLSRDQYLEWCLTFSAEHGVDFFFPQYRANYIVSHRELFVDIDVEVAVFSGLENPSIIDDKAAVYRLIEEAGKSDHLPSFWKKIDDKSLVKAACEEYDNQLCIKPVKGICGDGFFILEGASGIKVSSRPYTSGVSTIIDLYDNFYDSKPTLLCEYLPGAEYSVDLCFDEGVVVSGVVRQKESSKAQVIYPLTPFLASDNDVVSSIREAVIDIGKIAKLHGWSNMQFKCNTNNKPKFLEINPRWSGGIGIAAMGNPYLPIMPIAKQIGIWDDTYLKGRNNGELILKQTHYSVANDQVN